jgi:transposase
VISLEDWALIRRLVADGVPQRQVARDLGVARATVARAVASQGPPKYERASGVNSFTGVEAKVRALLAEHPDLPATVIAERIGWTGSITWLRDNVRPLRAQYRRPDPADRLEHAAGDVVQCDLWFPPVKIATGDEATAVLPVLVMVAAHSRFITAVMLPTRTTADLLAGTWTLLRDQLGAVPRRLLWDNEAGIGRGGRLAHGVGEFCGTLATRLVQCRPYDPESKGVVERANQYLETSFLPGRTFTSPADFNTQLTGWLTRAHTRTVRALRARPVDLIGADLAAMLPLPPVPPVVGWAWQGRLGRDYYVRVSANDYSVDPTVIGQMVDVTADLDRVRVRTGGRLVADHARAWGTGATITDPAHREVARRLRQDFQDHPAAATVDEVPVRDLADYDRAFAVDLNFADGRVA